MSKFPTAKLKRFNEVDDKDIPPVGTYDLCKKKEENASSFDKADRFKKPLDVTGTSFSQGLRTRSKDSLSDASARSTPSSTPSKKDRANDIRMLTREKSDLTKKIDSQSYRLMELQSQLDAIVAENNFLKQANENLSAKIYKYENSESKSGTESGDVEDCDSCSFSNYKKITEETLKFTYLRKEIRCVREELEFKTMKLNTKEEAQKNENYLTKMLQEALNAFNNSIEEKKLFIVNKINKVGDQIAVAGERIKEAEDIKSSLTEINKENVHLKNELQVELKNSEDKSRSIASLLENLDILKEEKMLLIKDHELVVVKLQTEIETCQRNELILKNELQAEVDSQEINENLRLNEMQDMKHSLELKNEEFIHLESQLQGEIERGQDLSKDLNLLRQKLQIASDEAENLRYENSELLLQLNLTKESNVAALKTLEEMKQTVDAFKVTEMDLNSRLNEEILNRASAEHAYSFEMGKQEELIKDLEIEKGRQIQTVKVLKEEVEIFQQSLAEVNSKFDIAKDEIAALNLKLEHANKTLLDAESEFNKKIISHKEIEDELRHKMSEEISRREAIEHSKMVETESKDAIISNLKQQLDQLTITVSEELTKKEMLESAVYGKDVEIESLKISVLEMTVQQNYNQEVIDNLTNNLSRKEEELTQFQDVIAKNHQLMSFKDSLVQDLESCHEKLLAASQANVELLKTVDNHTFNISQLEIQIGELLNQITSQSSDVRHLKEREEHLLLQINVMEDQLNLTQQDFSRSIKDAHQKLLKTEKELCSYQEKERNSKHNEVLIKLTADHEAQIAAIMNEQQNCKEEMLKWRTLYNELKEKIAPFRTQLDAYEIEKQVLESSSKEATHKLKKMGDELATLVGHHNQRQRIHYVNKLKDDCFQLKEENTKLWAEVLKLRKQFAHSTPSKVRKFDPKHAFKHAKENESTPLKESNRK